MNYFKAKILIRSYFTVIIDSLSNSIIDRYAILLNLIIFNFLLNCNNLWIQLVFEYFFDTNFALINAHTFLIGFNSGEYCGQSITVISLSM